MDFVILGILLNELSKDPEAGYTNSSLRKATEEAQVWLPRWWGDLLVPLSIKCSTLEFSSGEQKAHQGLTSQKP